LIIIISIIIINSDNKNINNNINNVNNNINNVNNNITIKIKF